MKLSRLAEQVNRLAGIFIQKQRVIVVEVAMRIVEIKHAVQGPGLEVVGGAAEAAELPVILNESQY